MKRNLFLTTVMSIVAAILLAGCGTNTIDMRDYVSVDFLGTDGRGTVAIKIDYESLAGVLNKEKKDDSLLGNITDYYYLADNITAKSNQSCDLSNGNQVTVTVNVSEEIMETYQFKATNTEMKVKVEGLTVPEKVDAFKNINVHFAGYAPFATASVENNSDNEFLKRVTYEVDKSVDLKNGDVITVTAVYTDSLVDQYGYEPENDEKEYTVEGLDSYVTSHDTLTETCLQAMREDSKDRVEALIAGKTELSNKLTGVIGTPYKYSVDLENLKMDTSYFLVSKGTDFGGKHANIYVAVYKTTGYIDKYNHVSGDTYDGDIFVAVTYYDIINTVDGTYEVNLANVEYTYFSSGDEAYSRWVTSNKDRYKTFEQKIG